MSDQVGLAHCARPDSRFSPEQSGGLHSDCSPHTAKVIDEQVKQILDTAYGEAKQILADHRDKLERVRARIVQTGDARRSNVRAAGRF